MSQSRPDTLGKYQIIREIARSNDIVYEGYDPVMNRRVAVKELAVPGGSTEDQKQDRVKRFLREAKAAGSLVHPNIVTVYDVDIEDGRYYLAMEFLDGETLRKRIENIGFLSPGDAIDTAIEVLKALGFAHKNGVVHRDVKPENIQILENGAVKLTDFGIARLTFEPNITMDGQVFGTPSYMSPEQIHGKEIDARSDIFSLGVVLYEMLSGQKPFTGDSVVSITYAIMNREPTQPAQANHSVWSVLCKALEKSPALRYDSTDELIADLKSCRDSLNSPVLPPVSPAGAAAPWNTVPSALVNPYAPPVINPAQAQAHAYAQGFLTPYGTPMPQGMYTPYAPGGSLTNTPYNAHGNPAFTPTPLAPGQVPVYYPPPPSGPIFSAETRTFFTKLFVAILLIGGLCAGIILGIQQMSGAMQPDGRPTNSARPNAGGSGQTPSAQPIQQPRSQPSQPATGETPGSQSREVQGLTTDGSEQQNLKLAQADLFALSGLDGVSTLDRKEIWDKADELYNAAAETSGGDPINARVHASRTYQTIADGFEQQGNRIGMREALYRALSFATDDQNAYNAIQARISQSLAGG